MAKTEQQRKDTITVVFLADQVVYNGEGDPIALARGLAILRSFHIDQRFLANSDIAERTGIPEARRGRVITLVNGLSRACTALALLLGGVLATTVGARGIRRRGGGRACGRDGCRDGPTAGLSPT